jgi:hypothetical protein
MSCAGSTASSEEGSAIESEEFDGRDAGLRSLVESGTGEKGSWLKARIQDAIKELNAQQAKATTVDQVPDRLPEAVRKAPGGCLDTASGSAGYATSKNQRLAKLPT